GSPLAFALKHDAHSDVHLNPFVSGCAAPLRPLAFRLYHRPGLPGASSVRRCPRWAQLRRSSREFRRLRQPGRRWGLSSVTRSLRRRVTDSQLVGERIEATVGRPYACPCDYDRGEQVGVDPSNPTPLQFPGAYEFDDFPARNGRDLRQCVVAREQRGTAAACPDEQLSEHQLVREHILARRGGHRAHSRTARARRGIESTPRYRRGRSSRSRFPTTCRARTLTTPRDVTRGCLRAAERTQTLMRGVTDQCLEPPANRLGVGRRSTGELGLREQVTVD